MTEILKYGHNQALNIIIHMLLVNDEMFEANHFNSKNMRARCLLLYPNVRRVT